MEERNKRVKVKATKWTAIVDLSILVLVLMPLVVKPSDVSVTLLVLLIILILLMAVGSCGLFKMLIVIFNREEDWKESTSFVESVLSSQEYTEVTPIKASKHEEFICGLTDIAKFYAIINEENKVKVSVKFNNESKFRDLESLDKAYFKAYYKLLDQN